VSAAAPRMNKFLSHLHTDRNVAILPEFEIYSAVQIITETTPDPTLVTYSDKSNDTSEDLAFLSTSFTVQKKVCRKK
jgi:hypothetical protein